MITTSEFKGFFTVRALVRLKDTPYKPTIKAGVLYSFTMLFRPDGDRSRDNWSSMTISMSDDACSKWFALHRSNPTFHPDHTALVINITAPEGTPTGEYRCAIRCMSHYDTPSGRDERAIELPIVIRVVG